MGIATGMYDLILAQTSCQSADMMNFDQKQMKNEKSRIGIEISQDNHTTAAKQNRLNEINSQTGKLSVSIGDTLQVSHKQVDKASAEQQNQDGSTAAAKNDDADSVKTDAANESASSADTENDIKPADDENSQYSQDKGILQSLSEDTDPALTAGYKGLDIKA